MKEAACEEMSEKYQRFMECCRKWARDASELMKGERMFVDVDVKKDKVYECLFDESVNDSEVRECKQILEGMCGAFVVLGERMFSDHLKKESTRRCMMKLRQKREVCRKLMLEWNKILECWTAC